MRRVERLVCVCVRASLTQSLSVHWLTSCTRVCACVACVYTVICDLNDPHNQVFLRGHDDQITALAISPSVSFLFGASSL